MPNGREGFALAVGSIMQWSKLRDCRSARIGECFIGRRLVVGQVGVQFSPGFGIGNSHWSNVQVLFHLRV
eukprot:5976468-Prymnesium_polylepis.2